MDTESGAVPTVTSRAEVFIDVTTEQDTGVELKEWQSNNSDIGVHPYKMASPNGPTTFSMPTPTTAQGFDVKKNPNIHILSHRRERSAPTRNPRMTAIQRVLLLNAYPLLYIILWIPGLANRLIEASGHSSQVFQVLQSSTQFVGLANAMTFGWNEEVATHIRNLWYRRT